MFIEVLRTLGRRWYVVLLGLLVTSGLVYGAYQTSPPEYHARGLVLLLPSKVAVGSGGNPFLELSGLEQPAGILVAYFSSAPIQAEIGELSSSAEYQVIIEDSTRGPVIAVEVTDTTQAETLRILDHLITRIPQELANLQNQVRAPADAAIRSMALTVDNKVIIDRAGTLRLMILALVVGVIATGFLGIAVDSSVQRRRRREAAEEAVDSADEPVAENLQSDDSRAAAEQRATEAGPEGESESVVKGRTRPTADAKRRLGRRSARAGSARPEPAVDDEKSDEDRSDDELSDELSDDDLSGDRPESSRAARRR